MTHLETRNLILIGYRGTGKTTVALSLARRLGRRFVDGDVEIERRAGKTIAEIFAQDGEPAFRDMEAALIADILKNVDCMRFGVQVKPPLNLSDSGLLNMTQPEFSSGSGVIEPIILSTGGGAVIRAATRDLLRAAGHVVWLTATPETILARLRGDATTEARRPDLTSLPPLEEIRTLLAHRHDWYQQTAHSTVATDDQSIDNIAETIVRKCCHKPYNQKKPPTLSGFEGFSE